MPPQVVFVCRDANGGAFRRRQAGSKIGQAGKKTQTQSSNQETVASSAMTAPRGPETKKKKTAKKNKSTTTSIVPHTSRSEPNLRQQQQLQHRQPQQASNGVLLPVSLNSVPNPPLPQGPVSTPKKSLFGRKTQAIATAKVASSLQLASPPASPNDSYSSSASTLVASSNASSPNLKPSGLAKQSANPKISVSGASDPILLRLSAVLTSIDGERTDRIEEELGKQIR